MHNVGQVARLQQAFPDTLVVIGVHSAKFPTEKETESIHLASQRLGIRHPVVNDAGFQVWNDYAVRAWPTVVLIDPNGKIVRTEAGEISAADYQAQIQAMIDEYSLQGVLNREPLDLSIRPPRRTDQPLTFPGKIFIAPDGRVFVADTGHHRILQIQLESEEDETPVGSIERRFGSGAPGFEDGLPALAAFDHPHGMALNGNTLYVADTGNHAIRAISLATGAVRTVAGTGEIGQNRFLGEPLNTPLRSPWDVLSIHESGASEEELTLLIAMAGAHQIWMLIDERRLGIFAGNGREALVDGPLNEASFNQPSGLALVMGYLLVADPEASAIRAIGLGGEYQVFTIVGQGLFEFGDIDGVGGEVRLQHPISLAFNEEHAPLVFVADSYNHKIKTLDPTTGEVRSLIGTGKPGMDDGPFDQASFNQPEGLAIYQNRLFIADTNNHLIRVANLETGQVSTLHLTGFEHLQNENSTSAAPSSPPIRLAPVQVLPGSSELVFKFELPQDTKLNPGSPIMLRLAQPQPEQEHVYTFSSEEEVRLPVNVRQDQELAEELPVELTLYYCSTGDERLCRIYDQRLLIPIQASQAAPKEAPVHVRVAE